MLVLSRYRDESIYIGDNVIVTVVDIRGDRVRLGIQAPSDVSVHRKEVYDAISREQTGEKPKPKTQQKFSSPLARELEARKTKGLPIEINAPDFGFDGLPDVITQ